jgi:iron-sulfur cluster assembly protein
MPFDFARNRFYEKAVIHMTDAAADALNRLLQAKPGAAGLRLGVEKGGCAGQQYVIEAGCERPGDLVFSHLGAKVFVDGESLAYLDGSTLDHEDGLTGAGFRIQNPRATRSCGCGTSFEPSRESAVR